MNSRQRCFSSSLAPRADIAQTPRPVSARQKRPSQVQTGHIDRRGLLQPPKPTQAQRRMEPLAPGRGLIARQASFIAWPRSRHSRKIPANIALPVVTHRMRGIATQCGQRSGTRAPRRATPGDGWFEFARGCRKLSNPQVHGTKNQADSGQGRNGQLYVSVNSFWLLTTEPEK